MPRQRKTDKARLKEGRGTGRLQHYKPWLKAHELSDTGRAHRPPGIKTRRIHQLLSDNEYYYFLIVEWSDNVIDIREQYPLLPLEETLYIASELGYKHSFDSFRNENVVMTTDFVITIKDGNLVRDIVRTIKPVNHLNKSRTKEKFEIERIFFEKRNIDWGVVTDAEIPEVLAKNIEFIRTERLWLIRKGFNEYQFKKRKEQIIDRIINGPKDIVTIANKFDKDFGCKRGENLNFIKYLLWNKDLVTDMNVKINFRDIEINVKRKDVC
jgi:hypothetical protein